MLEWQIWVTRCGKSKSTGLIINEDSMKPKERLVFPRIRLAPHFQRRSQLCSDNNCWTADWKMRKAKRERCSKRPTRWKGQRSIWPSQWFIKPSYLLQCMCWQRGRLYQGGHRPALRPMLEAAGAESKPTAAHQQLWCGYIEQHQRSAAIGTTRAHIW